jgi:hypothetical protein
MREVAEVAHLQEALLVQEVPVAEAQVAQVQEQVLQEPLTLEVEVAVAEAYPIQE